MELCPNDHVPDQSLSGHSVLDHHIYDYYLTDLSLHTTVNQLDCHYECDDFVRVYTMYAILLLTRYIEC